MSTMATDTTKGRRPRRNGSGPILMTGSYGARYIDFSRLSVMAYNLGNLCLEWA